MTACTPPRKDASHVGVCIRRPTTLEYIWTKSGRDWIPSVLQKKTKLSELILGERKRTTSLFLAQHMFRVLEETAQ